jgi:hypothetical protein
LQRKNGRVSPEYGRVIAFFAAGFEVPEPMTPNGGNRRGIESIKSANEIAMASILIT